MKIIGWREWVGLPELHVKALRVKVDTGAKTSALHAEDIVILRNKRTGARSVRFYVVPGGANGLSQLWRKLHF